MIEIKAFNELTTTELYALLKVRSEVFVVEQNCPFLEIDGKDDKADHLLYKVNGDIAAYCRIFKHGISYKEASIGRVVVAQAYRKEGYGREIMEKALDYLKNDLHETAVKISAQHYLQTFYESLGFVQISDVYLDDDIPHIDMLIEKL